ncbi:MAG: hypothetical protein Q8P93_01460 [bacterium]|nr:hypothetical protein [bacterium]
MPTAQKTIKEMLSGVDVQINGDRPWDLRVHDERLYRRVLSSGSRGLGESYMDGWWDVEALDEFFFRIMSGELDKKLRINFAVIAEYIRSRFLNQQRSGAFKVGEEPVCI